MDTMHNDVYNWPFGEVDKFDISVAGRTRRTKTLLAKWKDEENEYRVLQGILLMQHAQSGIDGALIGAVFHFGRISSRMDAINRQQRVNWLGEVMQGMKRGSKSRRDAQEELTTLETRQADYERTGC